MAVRRSRRGLRNCEQNPKSTRSMERRFGVRRRDRRMTKSCRLRRKFSARTALIPRVPSKVVRPASRRRIDKRRHFISTTLRGSSIKARKGRSGSQGTRIANSPCTGCHFVWPNGEAASCAGLFLNPHHGCGVNAHRIVQVNKIRTRHCDLLAIHTQQSTLFD